MRRPCVLAVLGVALASPAAAAPPASMGAARPGAPAISPESAARVGQLPAGYAPGTVQLTGLDGRTQVLTAADIAALPAAHVAVEHDGKTVDYSGPLLSDLLREVDAPMGVRLHGAGVNDVVMLTGADRFRVVLSLAEVDPSFHKGAKAILADRADGQPITGKQGPYRLVIDGDLHPSRSEYAVVAIAVKHLP